MDTDRRPKSLHDDINAGKDAAVLLVFVDGAVVMDLSGCNLTDGDLLKVVKKFSVVPHTEVLRTICWMTKEQRCWLELLSCIWTLVSTLLGMKAGVR
jgi:hypothetical protein